MALLVGFAALLVGLINVHTAIASQCACATAVVHVRSAAGTSHAILDTLQPGHCLTFKGQRHTVSGASWVKVDYHGKTGWIYEHYVHVSTCHSGHHTSGHPVQLSGCPKIITRAEWGARAVRGGSRYLPHTPKYMFIHHGASPPCHTKAACIQKVRGYQNYHMDTHGWTDIAYSFVVGEDGNVYEARGWDRIGGHTLGYNSVGLAICVIGDFTHRAPNQAALTAVKEMIDCGLRHHKLTHHYMLRGHRDVNPTSCPGNKYYALIKHWSHY